MAELIKEGGERVQNEIVKLVKRAWAEETIPKEWQSAVIVPIHKKKDKACCENYRGISLLNVCYKILSQLINLKLKPYVREIVGEYQAGFMPGKSTTDQIFIMRQIWEKMWEYNREVYTAFIDFSKAYDSINRKHLYNILHDFKVPKKLCKMVQVCTEKTRAKVRYKGQLSEEFDILTGVRQGDACSPALFNLVMEKILRECESDEERGIQLGVEHKWIAFADDVAVVAEDKEHLRRMIVKIKQNAKKVGLEINENKTEVMKMARNGAEETEFIVDDLTFKTTEKFKYLGSWFTADSDRKIDIRERIMAASRCFHGIKISLKEGPYLKTQN